MTLSFSFTPLAFGYVAGSVVDGIILTQMTRIRFKRSYHYLFIAAGATVLVYLVSQIWLSSANDAQTWLALDFPVRPVGVLGIGLGYHAVMEFTSPRLSNTRKLTTIAVYAVVLFIASAMILNLSIYSIGHVVRIPGGWLAQISYEGYYLYTAFEAIVFLGFFGFLSRYYLTLQSSLLKSQTRFLILGLLAPILGGVVLQILYGYGTPIQISIPAIDWLTYPVGFAIILGGFQKHGFLTTMPVAEEQASSPPKYDLATGLSYILSNSEPNRIYEIFDDLIDHGHFGLCITRVFPETVRQEHAIRNAPVMWLSESKRGDTIAPTDLVGLALTVQSFLEKAERPVVLLHGLEYLIFNNGFRPILHMIHQLGEVNAQKGGIVLIALVSGSLTERQQAMLKAECKPIEPTDLGLKAWLKGTSNL